MVTSGALPFPGTVSVAPLQARIPSTDSLSSKTVARAGMAAGGAGSVVGTSPSAPPSSENDPVTAVRVSESKKRPSSGPSQDGALIGQRQLSDVLASGPESDAQLHRNTSLGTTPPGRGLSVPRVDPLCSSNVPTTSVPRRAVAMMRASRLSSTSRYADAATGRPRAPCSAGPPTRSTRLSFGAPTW